MRPMPEFDFVAFGETDWSDLHALSDSVSIVGHYYIPPDCPDDDFLRNSRRQREAEMLVEVDE